MLATVPADIFFTLTDDLETMYQYITPITAALGGILATAAVIWTIAIAWRKFKESTNKV